MLSNETVEMLSRMADRLHAAGIFPAEVSTADKAFAIILAGHEMGFQPMQAARSIALVKGKVSLSADATIAVCTRSEVCEYFRLVESSATQAVYVTQRRGHPSPVELTYTFEQAKTAGLTGSGTWRAHPQAMLRARCGAALARAVYPDLVAGVYDPDEAEEINRGDRGGPKASPKKAEPAGEEPKGETAPPAAPAIPAELAAFHAALPSLAKPADGAALWVAHRPALNAAAEPHRKAAFNELAKAMTKFGGGVGSFSAAKGYFKTSLADHDEKAKAAAAQADAPAEPAPVAEPEARASESPAAEASPDPAPAQNPVLAAVYAKIAEAELPGECVAIWMHFRADLAPMPVADREAVWRALCKRTEEVGRMTNAKVWLKKCVAEEDARRAMNAEAAAGLTPDAMESLRAAIGTARDTATLAATWEAITADEYHRATDAQRATLDADRTAREKALRNPPQPPRGGRTRGTTSAPADANGNGERAANDATSGAPAMRHVVLDTDVAHITIAGTWRATEAGWREHLATMSARVRLINSVACNGGALGPRYLELAAKRLVEITPPDPLTGARLNTIGATILVERASLDGSRRRAQQAAEQCPDNVVHLPAARGASLKTAVGQ